MNQKVEFSIKSKALIKSKQIHHVEINTLGQCSKNHKRKVDHTFCLFNSVIFFSSLNDSRMLEK